MSHQRISTKLSSHWLMHGLSCKIFLARWERIIHIGCAVRHGACSAGSLQWSVWVQHRSPHTRIIFSLLLTKSGLHFTHWMRMLLGEKCDLNLNQVDLCKNICRKYIYILFWYLTNWVSLVKGSLRTSEFLSFLDSF